MEFKLRTEIGKNYSLLINDERFPIDTGGNQELLIQIFGQPGDSQPLPDNRVRIMYTRRQRYMSQLVYSRFHFTYDTPAELHSLHEREHLERFRGRSDWDTVKNVLLWTRRQFEPGNPRDYRSENALRLLDLFRSKQEQGFCAHYCYILVQSLQSLGIYARYVTIQNHETAEAWIPDLHKWVALDPFHGAYFTDSKGMPLSAYEIGRNPSAAIQVSSLKHQQDIRSWYSLIAVWLHNDLATHPVNIYDLNRYRCRLVHSVEEVKSIDVDDLYTFFPQDLYQSPTS